MYVLALLPKCFLTVGTYCICQNDRCVLAPDRIADRIVTSYTNLKSITIKTVDLIVYELKYICLLTQSLLNKIVDIIIL